MGCKRLFLYDPLATLKGPSTKESSNGANRHTNRARCWPALLRHCRQTAPLPKLEHNMLCLAAHCTTICGSASCVRLLVVVSGCTAPTRGLPVQAESITWLIRLAGRIESAGQKAAPRACGLASDVLTPGSVHSPPRVTAAY